MAVLKQLLPIVLNLILTYAQSHGPEIQALIAQFLAAIAKNLGPDSPVVKGTLLSYQAHVEGDGDEHQPMEAAA